MKKLLAAIIFFCSIQSNCVAGGFPIDSLIKGIHFEEGLTWKQIVAKAKKEGKYIFMDCYTTWCGPCKLMEKNVYPVASVGDVYNKKFICVKMQMDTGKNDNDAVKATYADARNIDKQYKIAGYPSFLFFMPDGRIAYRIMGGLNPNGFIQLATEATSKNYYVLLDEYKKGRRDLSEMRELARKSLEMTMDTVQSLAIQKEYFLTLKKEDLLTKDNIAFLETFTKSTKDFGFIVFLQNTDSVNKIMDDNNHAQQFVQGIIYKEMISPVLRKNQKEHAQPNWDSLSLEVKKRFGEYYAERVIIASRCSWGRILEDLPQYTKYLVLWVTKYETLNGHSTIQGTILNSYAWAIFQFSKNPEELNTALAWSSRSLTTHPDGEYMDTYANLLHKLDRTSEGLEWEEAAAKLNTTDAEIKTRYEKMKKGEPTWE